MMNSLTQLTVFSSEKRELREKGIAPLIIELISSEKAEKPCLFLSYSNANFRLVSPQKSPVCGGPGSCLLHQTASGSFRSWQEGDAV